MVTGRDVRGHLGFTAQPEPRVLDDAASSTGIRELTRAQLAVANRMVESHATVPDFQVETEVAMDLVISLRAQLRTPGDELTCPTLNDFVIKASALALRRHPRVNSSYRDGKALLNADVNIGVAVAADDRLVVPTVTEADKRSLTEIAIESRRLADAVRLGSITLEELSRGTFTISNLGMFGIHRNHGDRQPSSSGDPRRGLDPENLALDHGRMSHGNS